MGSRPLARLACPELVGRDNEIAMLREEIASTTTDSGAVVLISGDPGIGKSALLDRAAAIARHTGVRTLRGRGERLEIPRAFGPFIDLLGSLEHRGPAADAVLRAGPWASGHDAVRSAEERYRAHAAFARAITEVAEERPLMVAIDDLHWADESSLELFAYLARRVRRRLLLVGTYRSEETVNRPALRRAIEDVPRDRRSDMTLAPLSSTDTARALRLTLGTTFRPTREERERLETHSRGNPLFLEEILQALVRRGDLVQRDGTWHLDRLTDVPLPASVEEAVHERFRSLDESVRRTLIVAAIIGELFRFDVLERASSGDNANLIAHLRVGVEAQLIEEAGDDGDDLFRFHHALVREAILQEVLGLERRALHRKVARALERPGTGDPDFAAIASHYETAGDRDHAFEFHRRAGERDAQRGAFVDAATHYGRALDLAANDDRVRADLLMLFARTAGGLGQRARIFAAVWEAAERYGRLGAAHAEAGALLHLSNLIRRHMLAPLAENVRIERRTGELLAPLGDTPELAWHLARMALNARVRRDYGHALSLAEEGLAVATRCGAAWEEGVASWAIADVYRDMGDLPQTIAWYRKTVALTSRSPECGRMQMEITTSRALRYLLLKSQGESEETRSLQARVQQLGADYPGDRDLERLESLLYAPDWDEFVRMHDEWASAEGTETVMSAHMGLHRALVDIARSGPTALVDVERLRDALLRRRDVGPNIVDRNGEPTIASGLQWPVLTTEYAVQAALIAGDTARALEYVSLLSPFVARPRVPFEALVIFGFYGVLAATEAGDDATVAKWIERASWREPPPQLRWSAVFDLTSRYVAAEQRYRTGERDTAIQLFADLLNDPRPDAPDPIRSHLLSLRYCELLMARRTPADRNTATSVLATVASFYRKARATWFLGRLEERADRLGLRLPDEASDSATPSLTRREREVATMVAQGLTNREIAERLTLSVRTAESHVDQIRSKLGVRTRAQIAARVTQSSVDA